jgi:hypothetical protein
MADYAFSNPGFKQGGSDQRELFYKKWSGEVLTSFLENNIMVGRHMMKTITSGKSAAFPYIGKADSKYHVRGEDIFDDAKNYPQEKFDHAEKIINVDEPLMSSVFIADIDELMNEYDVRAPYTRELGSAIARKFDKQRLQLVGLGAQASAPLTGGTFSRGLYSAGTVINGGTTAATDAAVLLAAIQELATKMDEKDVPLDGRYLALSPAQHRLLVNSAAINVDFNPETNGSIASGKVFRAHGFELLSSNNIPTGSISQETGTQNTYHGTFTNYLGLAWQSNAIATVNLRDLVVEGKWFMERDGYGIKAKKVCGAGFLLPAACGAITSTTAT